MLPAALHSDAGVVTAHQRASRVSQELEDLLVDDVCCNSDELDFWRRISQRSALRKILFEFLEKGPVHLFRRICDVTSQLVAAFRNLQSFYDLPVLLRQIYRDELARIEEELFRSILLSRSLTEDRVKLLSRVNKVIARLRYVFLVVDGINRDVESLQVLSTPRGSAGAGASASSAPGLMHPASGLASPHNLRSPTRNSATGAPDSYQDEALGKFSRREVRVALDDLCGILMTIHSSYSIAESIPPSQPTPVAVPFHKDLEPLADSVEAQFADLKNKVRICRGKRLINTSTARRPTLWQQHWIKYAAVGVGALGFSRFLREAIRSGALQRSFWSIADAVLGKIREHIVEPIQDLITNLTDTLKRKEPIVSQEELVRDHMALARMLEEYSANRKIVESKTTNKLLKDPMSLLPSVGNKSSNTSTNKSQSSSASTSFGSSEGFGLLPSMESPDRSADQRLMTSAQIASMDELMRRYEEELQHPIKGMLFGDLLTAILIQMQKLKVHTQSAMITMDQVLSSNELTMTMTAAFPAFMLLGGTIYVLKGYLLPKPIQKLGGIPKLRIALAEIMRTLQDVEDGEIDPFAGRNEEEVWYGRGLLPFSSEPSYQELFPGATVPSSGHAPSPLTTGVNNSADASAMRAAPNLVSPGNRNVTWGVSAQPDQMDTDEGEWMIEGRITDTPATKSSMNRSTLTVTPTPSKLKVDAERLIKWGKGKDAEYRHGLLVYRVLTLKRLITEYLGVVSTALERPRMDVGTSRNEMDDDDLQAKAITRMMGLFGVDAEEYYCLCRDIQDLMLPDFEIKLRRKMETCMRMQRTYKCFSTSS